MLNTKAGFTLIEMMIAVAIVGILAAIAYPSYQKSIQKSNRAEAKTELVDVAQRLQRCYTAFARFDDDVNCAVYKDVDDGGYITRGSNFYIITITHIAGSESTTYTLKAKADKPPQTNDTGCTELTLTHTGVQAPEECW